MNGSVATLNAKPQNFSSSLGLTSTFSSLLLYPWMLGTSSGDGKKSTTASIIFLTPLFLKLEPQITGKNSDVKVPLRIHILISSIVNSSPFKYFSIHLSSKFTISSIMIVRNSLALSTKSAGMSSTLAVSLSSPA